MKVAIDGRVITLGQPELIGHGGESNVYFDPDYPNERALKIYHAPNNKRARKLEWLVQAAGRVPTRIIAPLQLAMKHPRGGIVGFSMRRLDRRYSKLIELFTPSFCSGHGITTRVVADMFEKVGDDLLHIHKQDMLVGDLNDGGIMIHQDNHDFAWVDVDSWHTEQFPCLVGNRLYLCPELYDVKLDEVAPFLPRHDWWSYSVLLFRALLRKHPFKAGEHPAIQSYTERALNGITVLDSPVKYPSGGPKPEILSDALADALLRQLKCQHKGPFPLDELRAYADELIECKGCHVWYPSSRSACPQCSEKTFVDLAKILGVEVIELITSHGRILHVQHDGTTVTCVAEEAGSLVLYRSDAKRHVRRLETGLNYSSEMSFGVFGDVLAICVDEDEREDEVKLYLLEIQPDPSTGLRAGRASNCLKPLKESSTAILMGRGPIFATSPRFLYRLVGNMLMCVERFGGNDTLERPVTQVFRNQCWFTCDTSGISGKEMVFGFNRDVHALNYFLSVADDDGKFRTCTPAIPPLEKRESLVDMSVRFSPDSVLLIRKTLKRGRETVRLDRMNHAGTIEASEVLTVEKAPQWERVHGRAFAGKTILHPTDAGLVRENAETHVTQEVRGTSGLVDGDDSLIPFGPDVLVVRPERVVLLKRK